jgi:hypothetical protein
VIRKRGAVLPWCSGISQAISGVRVRRGIRGRWLWHARRPGGQSFIRQTNLRLSLWPLARARRNGFLASLAHCDWCLPSQRRRARNCSKSNDKDIADRSRCHAAGAPIVVLKCGTPTDASVSNGTRTEMLRGHEVADVDATGAGGVLRRR